MKRIIAILLAAVLALSLAACGGSGIDISQPEHLATFDEPSYLTEDNGAVEESFNVNGRRFNLTLYEFTSKYNAEKHLRGDKDLLKMDNWKKNGWVTASKTPVKNQDLWTRLLDAIAPHKISFRWVKGHDDHPENERCDKLATSAADKVGWSLDDSAEPFSRVSDWFEPGESNASASADAAGDTYAAPSASETGKKEVAAAALSGPMKKQLSTSASSGKGKKEADASVSWETGSYHPAEAEPAQKIRIRYLSDKIEKLQPPTNSANWIDLRAAEDVELKKGDFRLISLGVAMKLPEGYEAHIVPRSSTYKNFGIIQANHHGVVDNAYCGDGDLWRMPVIAMRDTQIHINDRICQFRIERRQPDIIFEEVDHLESEDRGGFGSTGVQ